MSELRYQELLRKFGGTMLVAAAATSGCANPSAPSLDPMQQWAADHAHETCVMRNEPGHNIRFLLVPIGAQVEAIDTVVTISVCNPHE